MFLSGARFGVDGPSGAGAGDVHSSGKGTVKGSVTFLGFLGWIILWPSWLLTRFVIVPMTNTESRTAEYEADAGAAAAGLGGGLQRALERLSVLEIPRNAWDAAITSTHPPIELRIDALDEETYTVPADPQEASAKRVGTLVGVLAILAAMAIAPHMPYYHHQHDNWWW